MKTCVTWLQLPDSQVLNRLSGAWLQLPVLNIKVNNVFVFVATKQHDFLILVIKLDMF